MANSASRRTSPACRASTVTITSTDSAGNQGELGLAQFIEDALEPWDTAHGRRVRHASAQHDGDVALYLRANPHHFPLGKLAFRLIGKDGTAVAPPDVHAIHQELDLWSGLLASRYEIDGVPVHVQTVCHPAVDTVAVRVESELVSCAQLQVVLHFPYVHDTQGEEYKNRPRIIWNQPDRHATYLLQKTGLPPILPAPANAFVRHDHAESPRVRSHHCDCG